MARVNKWLRWQREQRRIRALAARRLRSIAEPVVLLGITLFILLFAICYRCSEDEAALRFVAELRLGDNLQEIGLIRARQRPEYQVIVSRVGTLRAEILTAREVRVVSAKYQYLWDVTLASSYAEYFDRNELRSLTKHREDSEYAEKYRALRPAVGTTMEARASGLLNRVVIEALTTTYSHVIVQPSSGSMRI